MPSATATFVIVGLTNGPAFTPNPCLADQAAWSRSHHVWADPYAVLSYPTTAQLTKGQYNLARMRAAGLTAPVIWMDVEVYPSRPWSSTRSSNKAVVDGALAAPAPRR